MKHMDKSDISYTFDVFGTLFFKWKKDLQCLYCLFHHDSDRVELKRKIINIFSPIRKLIHLSYQRFFSHLYSLTSLKKDSMMNFFPSALPEDLMVEILVCLPVKSIVRFRCVSKTWCDMLKSPIFINSHLRNQRRRNVLLVRRCLLPPSQNDDLFSFHDPNSPELEEVCPNLSIPFLKDIRRINQSRNIPTNVCILGPCNGLVCIFYFEFVILCNPALRKFKQLPPCPIDGFYNANGFGNTSTNDYKVVLSQVDPYRVNLYNSSTNSWKQVDDVGENDPYIPGSPYTELFFNGVCHWSARRRPNFEIAILCFDLVTEVSGWLEYPDISTNPWLWSSFMVINGCFAVVCLSLCEKVPIDIWVMKEYGTRESWIKQFVIGPFKDNFYPFLPWENEWLLLERGSVCGNYQLMSCSFYTNEIKKYQVYGQKNTLKALIYQESLISLDQV